MRLITTETHLTGAVAAHLRRNGWKTRTEVSTSRGGRIDLLAVLDDRYLLVESKLNIGGQADAQRVAAQITNYAEDHPEAILLITALRIGPRAHAHLRAHFQGHALVWPQNTTPQQDAPTFLDSLTGSHRFPPVPVMVGGSQPRPVPTGSHHPRTGVGNGNQSVAPPGGLRTPSTTPQREPVDLSSRLAYSPAEAAQLIGLSRARLYQLLDDGTLPSVKLGRRRLVRREALVELLDGLTDPQFA